MYEFNGEKYDNIDELMNDVRDCMDMDGDDYEEFLNDCYGDVNVCGYYHGSGTLLREIDPTTFDIGKDEEIDSVLEDFKSDVESCGEEGCIFDVPYCNDKITVLNDEEETEG